MSDPRILKLAKNLVNYSCKVKKGEKVMIEAFGIPNDLVKALVKETYNAGGYPFVYLRDHAVMRAMLMDCNEEYCNLWAKYDGFVMDDMDCYIGVRGGVNSCEMGDIPADKNGLYQKLYSYPVHHEKRVGATRWVVLRYPTPSMAQMSGMSTEAFEDFYFDVCTMDYGKMDKAMDALKEIMEKTDKVRLIAKDTDLTFSIKGMPAIKCAGELNIPDGEIYSAPVKNSVNGVITYNAPSMQQGLKHENVRLEFKDHQKEQLLHHPSLRQYIPSFHNHQMLVSEIPVPHLNLLFPSLPSQYLKEVFLEHNPHYFSQYKAYSPALSSDNQIHDYPA